jgi:hypothetical protein
MGYGAKLNIVHSWNSPFLACDLLAFAGDEVGARIILDMLYLRNS